MSFYSYVLTDCPVKPGDVIQGSFQNGAYELDQDNQIDPRFVCITFGDPIETRDVRMTDDDVVEYATQNKRLPPGHPYSYKKVKVGAIDPSRNKAEFVVLWVERYTNNEGYPTSYSIFARRLNRNGTDNPKGEVLYIPNVYMNDSHFRVVRQMKQTFA